MQEKNMMHGNDMTSVVTLFRGGEKVRRCDGSDGGLKPYQPAEVGDVLRHDQRWEHTVTEGDIARGYVVYGTYQSVHSGRMVMPVFLGPRAYHRPGNAGRPSESRF